MAGTSVVDTHDGSGMASSPSPSSPSSKELSSSQSVMLVKSRLSSKRVWTDAHSLLEACGISQEKIQALLMVQQAKNGSNAVDVNGHKGGAGGGNKGSTENAGDVDGSNNAAARDGKMGRGNRNNNNNSNSNSNADGANANGSGRDGRDGKDGDDTNTQMMDRWLANIPRSASDDLSLNTHTLCSIVHNPPIGAVSFEIPSARTLAKAFTLRPGSITGADSSNAFEETTTSLKRKRSSPDDTLNSAPPKKAKKEKKGKRKKEKKEKKDKKKKKKKDGN